MMPRIMHAAASGTLGALGSRVRRGKLTIRLPDGRSRSFDAGAAGPDAVVELRRTRPLGRVLTRGAIGLADSYIDGDYDSPDLAAVLELGALHLEPGVRPDVPVWLERFGRAVWQTIAPSDRLRGPLRTTVEHYDLGNEFYALWLDPTMTYSSARFVDEEQTLEEAQLEKYASIAEIADLGPDQDVLEIGSGWGGFAVYAAERLGCRVVTVTVSREQHAYVEKLIAERGLVGRVEARLEDFDRTRGAFDRIVSIEMIESIPARRWPGYLRALHDLLVPGGRFGLQSIFVADHHWRSSDANPDFIRRYVFPGAQVPAPSVLRSHAAAAGLRWGVEREFGRSYARTLRRWRENFEAAWPEIARLGFDERFRRMWRYYLSYCEAGFAVGRTGVLQVALDRPR